MPIDVKLTTKVLDKMLNDNPGKAEQATKIAADLIVNDIRDHWSGSSPSSPGQAPAVVTETLDTSVEAVQISGGERPTYSIDATAPYAGYLEQGTVKMAKRPFIYPAMKRMRDQLRDVFKVHFKT